MNKVKHGYTVPCSSALRDAVLALAARQRVNVADLARSVLLVVPPEIIQTFPDPGEPAPGDRELVVNQSGASQGRPWRRKPRLQVRLPQGVAIPYLRRALALALAIDRGEVSLHSLTPSEKAATPVLLDELDRLRAIVELLSFRPLSSGVRTRAEALHIMGFPPGFIPDQATVRARFRQLATVYHPDGAYGSHLRMSQLNAAMTILRRNWWVAPDTS
ncbi:MAG: J domain-containing protein [Alphaproteobacteria bacterium]|nr:J domain-containing protein [Alphaproteobacteria bacterium]